MGYFIKTIRPDVINGDVSTVIGAQNPTATDAPFAAGDILFDWTAVDVPIRTNAIVDGTIHVYGEDGSNQVAGDIMLLVAKSNSNVAPTSLGTVNAAVTGCYELPDILLNIMKFEGNTNRSGKLDLGSLGSTYYYWNIGSSNGQMGPLVIQPESNNLSGVSSTNRIYVAGIAGGSFDFSTGVKPTASKTTSDTTIAVDGVDPRKAFRVGDTIYTNSSDTSVGEISSMSSSEIVLAAAARVAVGDNDELVNASPITINLSFSMKH